MLKRLLWLTGVEFEKLKLLGDRLALSPRATLAFLINNGLDVYDQMKVQEGRAAVNSLVQAQVSNERALKNMTTGYPD